MPILGQIAALATAFCWSLTAIFFSYSGRLVGSQVVNRSRLLFAMLFAPASGLPTLPLLVPRVRLADDAQDAATLHDLALGAHPPNAASHLHRLLLLRRPPCLRRSPRQVMRPLVRS